MASRKGMSGNNPSGRPSRWEYGNPKVLPHVGAPGKEPADEFGLIKAEHDINVNAVAAFEAFAPPGASQQDRDVKKCARPALRSPGPAAS